ncbi:MAG: hypothetical protein OXC11_16115 [Rhodospirillales bacterium]|nr:hypothetical protein [Rhodospirillales bacterium]
MFIPKHSSPLTQLRRKAYAQERRRHRAATIRGVVVIGLLLLLLVVAYGVALPLLHDLKIHLGYKA